jgi:hypothetical protein
MPRLAALGLALLLALCPSLPRAEPAPSAPGLAPTVVARWNEAYERAVAATLLGPPMAARALAILDTCIFDAWAAYDARAVGTRLGGALRRPAGERTPENKAEAVSFAAFRALVDLFPTEQATLFVPLLVSLGYDPTDASTDPATPAGVGNVACAAVLAFRHGDGSNQLGDLAPGPYSDWTGYAPVNPPAPIPVPRATVRDPNRWQPLVYQQDGTTVVQTFLGAQWFEVAPFALTSGAQFRPFLAAFGPPRFPTVGYLAECAEMVAMSASLDDRRKMIAEYWANGPNDIGAVAHWAYFARFVSARDRHTLDQDVVMFFALGNAELDASIAVWDGKRAFDYVRPVTAVPYVFTGRPILAWAGPGRGTRLIDGSRWIPYLEPPFHVTPPFPEYPSGHSAFGATGAEILRRFTGSDAFGASVVLPPGSSRIEPGITPRAPVVLAWPTFTAAAAEDGISRRYGGVHFYPGDLTGRALGVPIADQAWAKAQTYVDGTATGP